MEEVTVVPGEAASGMEKYDIIVETQGYEQQRGRNKNYVPTTAFCPQCSELTEWDAKWGEPKLKWSLKYQDFCFDLEYTQDETGEHYVKCTSCGHDLRNEPQEMEGKSTAKQTKTRSRVDFQQEWLKNVKLHNGFYVMSVQEFKRMAVIGYKSSLKMNPCAKIGGNSYYVLWDDFLQHYENMTFEGVKSIGIARQHWKIL